MNTWRCRPNGGACSLIMTLLPLKPSLVRRGCRGYALHGVRLQTRLVQAHFEAKAALPRRWQKEVCPLIAKPAAVAHDFRQVLPSSAKPIRSALRPKRSLVTVSQSHRNSGSAIAIIPRQHPQVPPPPAPVQPAPACRPSPVASPTRGSSAAGRRRARRNCRPDCQAREGIPSFDVHNSGAIGLPRVVGSTSSWHQAAASGP